jgi:DNA-binding MarR family transcriptional regulator
VLAFLRLLWALDHGLQRVSRRMQLERGVTGPQRLLLRILTSSPPLSPGMLAQTLHLHPSTVTGILKRLERGGLVKRQPDPDDRRRVIVSATGLGRRAAAHGTKTVEALVEQALGVFPAAKIAATEEVLRTLANVLEREVDG